MSRAVIYETFGGPEVLELRKGFPELQRRPGRGSRVRRWAAAGPEPDGLAPCSSMPEAAAQFGITLPSGFGYDFAGNRRRGRRRGHGPLP